MLAVPWDAVVDLYILEALFYASVLDRDDQLLHALGGHDVATVGIALLLIKGMLLQYDMPVVEKVGEVDSGGQVVGGDQKFLV